MTHSFTSPPRVAELDGLRGLAIGLVLVHHFFPLLLGNVPGSLGAYVAAALTLSFTGVDLRRAARILPLAFVSTAVILGAQAAGLYGPPEGGPPWTPGVYLLFVTNLWMAAAGDWGYRPLAQLWSLAIEEQFYLVAPLLIRFARPTHIAWLLLAFMAGAPLARLALLAVKPDAALAAGMLPFCRMDGLGAGMLVAWVMRGAAARAWCEQRRTLLVAVGATAAVGCTVLTKLRAGNAGFAMAAGGDTVVAVFYGTLLLLVLTHRGTRLNRVLATAPLTLLGRYSYFLYLFQGVIIGLTVGLAFHGQLAVVAPTTWLELAAGIAVLLAAAHVSWRWFESPLLALGRRLAY